MLKRIHSCPAMESTSPRSGTVSGEPPVEFFYVVDWLPPDFGAVGQYAAIFARDISQGGRNVTLIGLTTGALEESVETTAQGQSFKIKKLSAKRYNKLGLFGRLIWSLKANLKLVAEVAKDPRSKGADILFTGSPPFMLFFAVPLKFIRGARLVYRITDFYPEVIIAALNRPLFSLGLVQSLVWFLRKRIDIFEVLGEDQRQLLLAGGIAPEKIVLKRDISPITFTGAEKPAPRPEALTNRKALLYSGNYGVAHDVDTVVEGLIAHHKKGNGKFGLWLNASGSSIAPVTKRLAEASVPFACTDPVPLEHLAETLIAADAHLVTLRSPFSGLVLPSKIYGCLLSGRPILYVGPRSSDIHLLCEKEAKGFYEQVEPGDVAAFASALERLAQVN